MSDWELIDFDPGTGLRKWMNYDEAADEIQIAYDQDKIAEKAIIDSNKSAQAHAFDKSSDFWHAAHIPIGVMYEWKVKHGVDAWDPNHKQGVMRLLNSSDYRYLRVRNFII